MTNQPAETNEILRISRRFREALVRHDRQALNRLMRAYENVYARLKDKIDLLIDAIEMEEPTAGQLVRMARYQALIRQIEAELTGYQAILRNEITNQSYDAIGFAGRDARRILNAYGVTAGFNRLPAETIKTLLGFLSEDSPLWKRIGELAGANAKYVADKIIEGVSLGYNPRKIANIIRDALGGGLTDALRMTRTVQLWSYREATRANYLNNDDVVSGWVWWADLGGDPCMACIAEHGTVHGLDEALDDHYNGRCAMIPVVSGFPSIVEQTGEEWFGALPEAKQRELMGPEFFDAWKGGAFKLSDMHHKEEDAVYGMMTTATPLWQLLGAESPLTTQ